MPTQDGQIRITVGAVRDASIKRVFGSIVTDAKRAGQQVRSALNMGPAIAELHRYRTALTTVETSEARLASRRRQMADEFIATQRRQTDAVRAQAKAQSDERRRASSSYRRMLAGDEAAARRSTRRQDGGMRRFGRIVSHRTSRFLQPNAPILSMAGRHALGVSRAIGLNLSPEMQLASIAEQEDLSRHISTQAYVKGAAGAAGVRVDPSVLRGEMRDLVKRYGTKGGTMSLLTAGEAFVGQRGNLGSFRDIAPELAKRMTAYSISGEDAGLQAAKIESALVNMKQYQGDANKGKLQAAIIDVFDNLTYQGKIGSIEAGEMSKQLPKLSGLAGLFGGDPAQTIKELVALAQLAERGPGQNPATAATFTKNFAQSIVKNSEKLKDAGVNPFDDNGMNRSLSELIPEILAATQNNKKIKIKGKRGLVEVNQAQQMMKIFANQREFLALMEPLTVMRGAGGGQAGVDAIRREFARFTQGTNAGQVNEDVAAKMGDVGVKVEQLNASLEGVAERMSHKLVPILEKVEGPLIEFADKLADVTTWVVDNPKKAIGAAIGISLARAGLETVLRFQIEAMFNGAGALLQSLLRAMVGGQAVTAGGSTAVKAAAGGATVGAGATLAAIAGTVLGTDIADVNLRRMADEGGHKRAFKLGFLRDNEGEFSAGGLSVGHRVAENAAALAERAGVDVSDDTVRNVGNSLSSAFMALNPFEGVGQASKDMEQRLKENTEATAQALDTLKGAAEATADFFSDYASRGFGDGRREQSAN